MDPFADGGNSDQAPPPLPLLGMLCPSVWWSVLPTGRCLSSLSFLCLLCMSNKRLLCSAVNFHVGVQAGKCALIWRHWVVFQSHWSNGVCLTVCCDVFCSVCQFHAVNTTSGENLFSSWTNDKQMVSILTCRHGVMCMQYCMMGIVMTNPFTLHFMTVFHCWPQSTNALNLRRTH